MKINDLKEGMSIRRRKGDKGIIIANNILFSNSEILPLDLYYENLNSMGHSYNDITEVYTPKLDDENSTGLTSLKLLWKRED